jgi:Uma2 family endonuclease
MIAIPDKPFMTPDEYLAWEEKQELRYEYVDGVAYVRNDIDGMTGGTLPHNDIALNLYSALRSPMRTKGCRVNVADVKVHTSEDGAFFYPDLLVSCHPQDKTALKFVRHPCLIVEVLSPSTESYDRGAKFAHYRRLESLQEYVLISSDRVNVEIFRLNERHKWELTPYAAGETVQFTSIEFECPIELLYEEVDLSPEDSTQDLPQESNDARLEP